MSHQSPPRLRVLHAVRLRGFADDDTVTRIAQVDGASAQAELAGAAAEGLVLKREGRLSGWTLTPDGRAHIAKLVADELSAAACRDAVESAYQRFLAINQGMLGCCTQWQVRTVDGGEVPNDHSDPAHDVQAIAKLAEIDDSVQQPCADLAGALERFGHYGPRLRDARARVEAGDTDWFTKPLIDSYHTVWFELHEDLLVTLGIERSKELGGGEAGAEP